MQIQIHIISNNYTKYRKIKIDFNSIKILDLINYLYKHNIIYSTNYIVFYNNNEIQQLPNLDNFSIIIRENRENKKYKEYKCHL